MTMPSAIAKQREVNAAVTEVVEEMSPQVVHIRHEFGQDWTGDPAIYFRVLLSDEASEETNLRIVARQVESKISKRLDFLGIETFPYFNYRSQSEQAEMKGPEWA